MLNDLLGKEATIQPPTQEEGADRRPDTAMEAAETFFGPDVVQNEIALESLRKRGLYTPEDNMKSAEESAQVFEDEQRAKQSENIRREWEARKTSYQQPIGLLGTASPGTVDILDAQGNVVFSDPEAATDTKALPAPEKPTQALPVPETSYGDGFTFRGSEQERPILTTGGSPFKKESSALMAIRLKGLDPNLYGVTPYQGGFAITRNTGKTEFRISNEDAQDLAGFRDERIRAEEAISRRLDADKEMVPDVPPEETVSFPEIPMQVQPAEASLSADEIQPWQMTRAEIAQIEKVAGQIDSFSSSEVSIDGVTIPFERTKFDKDHKKAVQQALAENKPVPPEVLADYPDLTAENVLSPEARPAPDKRQAAIDRYIEHAKAYTSEEGARQQADKWAKAIDAKDYKTLRNIMNGINPKVNRLFTELTGLPAKTQKQADESLRSFDPEGWDKWQAERTEKREKEAAEREAAHRQRQADALLDKKVNYQGEVMATRDMYQRLVNEGLTRIESRKHGIADEYWLANPDTGMGVKIPKKILVDHIRGLIEQKNPTQKSNLPEASDADLDHLFGKVTPDSAHEAGRKAFSESKTRIVPETWTAEHKKAWYDGWDKANLEAQVESPEKKTGPTRVKISEDYKAAIQLIKDTIQRAFDSKKVIPVYGVTASGQREEIVGSTFHKNPVKSLKYGYSVGKLTERIGAVTKSVSVPLEQYEYIEIGGAEITEKPSQGGTVTIAHVGEKGATKGITIDLREPGKAAEEKIKEVEKALKPKPTPDLTKKSTAELVGDIYAIINDHIGQRGSVSLKEKALDDTLYEKIKPYIKVIADRAKAKALDVKAYLFGAVDSMPEGQAKDIYEAAADRYVEDSLKEQGDERKINTETKQEEENAAPTGNGEQEKGTPGNDRGSLAGKSPENVSRIKAGGETSGLSEGEGGLDNGGIRSGERSRKESAGKEGLSGEGSAAERDRPEGMGGSTGDVSGVQRHRNHRIELGSIKRQGSWKATAETNLDIIELVKRLESENRQATPEEQALLSRYTGWGASELANNMFPGYAERGEVLPNWLWGDKEKTWKPSVERLVNLLTSEEIRTAARSTQYAHYTSEAVIRSIYKALDRFGFNGGKILEPGMGVGSFAGLIPDNMVKGSSYTGIEMDGTTASIAKYLYPGYNVIHGDYTKQAFPNNFFDLAIGNPPFSSTVILSDPAYKKHRFKLHDYFFAKTIDKVRPGGLLVFITSRYTMDKQDNRARRYLSERADLMGAIRLPQTAFQQNAGTEVVTDVLFLRKKIDGEETTGQAWDKLAEVTTPEGPAMVNEYFADHPEMVLGNHSLKGKMYSKNEYTVMPLEGADIEDSFAKAVEKLPEKVYSIVKKSPKEQGKAVVERDFNPKNKKEGGLYLSNDGKIMENAYGSGVPIESTRKVSEKER